MRKPLVYFSLLVAVLSGCNQGSPSVTPVGGLAKNAGTFPVAGTVYIATDNYVYVYTQQARTLEATITSGIRGADAMTFDRFGTLYVANRLSSTVTAYRSGTTTPTRALSKGVSRPVALRMHRSLYVANAPRRRNASVTVLSPLSGAVQTTITKGVNHPFAIALDAKGTVYVANAGDGSASGPPTVSIYSAGASSPSHTLSFINSSEFFGTVTSIAVDDKGYLYVALSYYTAPFGSQSGTSVLIFAPGRFAKPIRTLDVGKALGSSSRLNANISNVALDASGNLYVAVWTCPVYASSSGGLLCGKPYHGAVLVYAGLSQKILHTIPSLYRPNLIVLDKLGNLYVSDCSSDNCKGPGVVRAYAPGGTTPVTTVTTNAQPTALATEP